MNSYTVKSINLLRTMHLYIHVKTEIDRSNFR